MRLFILKTFIVTFAFYLLFQFTVGYRIDNVYEKFKSISNQHERDIIKQKILNEIKEGNKKDYIFSSEDRIIISTFIKKIFSELNLLK